MSYGQRRDPSAEIGAEGLGDSGLLFAVAWPEENRMMSCVALAAWERDIGDCRAGARSPLLSRGLDGGPGTGPHSGGLLSGPCVLLEQPAITLCLSSGKLESGKVLPL